MRKTTTYCDRCGCETTPSANRTIDYNKVDTYTFRITIDLCKSCYDAFIDFISKGERE